MRCDRKAGMTVLRMLELIEYDAREVRVNELGSSDAGGQGYSGTNILILRYAPLLRW